MLLGDAAPKSVLVLMLHSEDHAGAPIKRALLYGGMKIYTNHDSRSAIQNTK